MQKKKNCSRKAALELKKRNASWSRWNAFWRWEAAAGKLLVNSNMWREYQQWSTLCSQKLVAPNKWRHRNKTNKNKQSHWISKTPWPFLQDTAVKAINENSIQWHDRTAKEELRLWYYCIASIRQSQHWSSSVMWNTWLFCNENCYTTITWPFNIAKGQCTTTVHSPEVPSAHAQLVQFACTFVASGQNTTIG